MMSGDAHHQPEPRHAAETLRLHAVALFVWRSWQIVVILDSKNSSVIGSHAARRDALSQGLV